MFVDEVVAELPNEESLQLDLESPIFDAAEYSERRSLVVASPETYPDLRVIGKHIYRSLAPTDAVSADVACWRLWVPEGLATTTIDRAHSLAMSAHRGVSKTIDVIRRFFFWPRLSRHV